MFLSILFTILNLVSGQGAVLEELVLKLFDSGIIMSHLQFIHILKQDTDDYTDFHTFFRQNWETVQCYEAQELHLAFAQGSWKTKQHGFAPRVHPLELRSMHGFRIMF